jgi:hypothetical protein
MLFLAASCHRAQYGLRSPGPVSCCRRSHLQRPHSAKLWSPLTSSPPLMCPRMGLAYRPQALEKFQTLSMRCLCDHDGMFRPAWPPGRRFSIFEVTTTRPDSPSPVALEAMHHSPLPCLPARHPLIDTRPWRTRCAGRWPLAAPFPPPRLPPPPSTRPCLATPRLRCRGFNDSH